MRVNDEPMISYMTAVVVSILIYNLPMGGRTDLDSY